MNIENIVLRNETAFDHRKVEALTREAFWNLYVPGCDEHYLLHTMRKAESFIDALDVVAEADGTVVGNIVYARAMITDDHGESYEVITFGPVSVTPVLQGKGIGRKLIEYTIKKAKELGYRAILIYGDPDYYSKYGFKAAELYDIGTSENMYAASLQALELYTDALSNISGRFIEGKAYDIDKDAAEEFNKGFPHKDRISDLPSQKRFMQWLSRTKPRP